MKRRKKGSHTWDLHLHYHRCPSCGYINEDRQKFQYNQGKYFKDVTCSRCNHEFVDLQDRELQLGPFFGDNSKPEMDWK